MTRKDCGSKKWLELTQESGTDHDGDITSLQGRWCCQDFTKDTGELRDSETFPKSHSGCGRPGSGSHPRWGALFLFFLCIFILIKV